LATLPIDGARAIDLCRCQAAVEQRLALRCPDEPIDWAALNGGG